jgi:hypothetical protein
MVTGALVTGPFYLADLPIFRTKEHRPRQCKRVYSRCSRAAMDCYRPSCTNKDE